MAKKKKFREISFGDLAVDIMEKYPAQGDDECYGVELDHYGMTIYGDDIAYIGLSPKGWLIRPYSADDYTIRIPFSTPEKEVEAIVDYVHKNCGLGNRGFCYL